MILSACVALAVLGQKPLMKDFIGLNTHTVQFKTDLYKPVTGLLRNYHGFSWDVGDDSSYYPRYPLARNGVNWEDLYGGWKKAGYRTTASLMFEEIKGNAWKDVERDGYGYGFQFARFFGPSGHGLVEALEIGNEPGELEDDFYRRLFKAVAEGARKGDPRLKIATCAVFDRPSARYHKSLSLFKGMESLYDVINVHSYPELEPYPTWRRSFPEDPRLKFFTDIQDVIDWRDKNAVGKEVWLTEFGYDSSTKPNEKEGTFKDWIGVTDRQQAQWIVRAYLGLASTDLDRAYLFWFNDEDKPSLHASSGLTRNYVPKPSYWAVAHLQKMLGEYRFLKAIKKDPSVHLYEFDGPSDKVWVAWSPTGADKAVKLVLPKPSGTVASAERMPLKEGAPESVGSKVVKEGIEIEVTETPVYLRISPSTS